MTVAQIKKSLRSLPTADHLFLLHYLGHLVRAESETNRRDLARRHKEIESGRKLTLAQVKRLDAALRAEGL